jgi:hypothetical protein
VRFYDIIVAIFESLVAQIEPNIKLLILRGLSEMKNPIQCRKSLQSVQNKVDWVLS